MLETIEKWRHCPEFKKHCTISRSRCPKKDSPTALKKISDLHNFLPLSGVKIRTTFTIMFDVSPIRSENHYLLKMPVTEEQLLYFIVPFVLLDAQIWKIFNYYSSCILAILAQQNKFKRFSIKPYYMVDKTSKDYLQFRIFKPTDLSICGNLIPDFLAKEFDHRALPIDPRLCVWCYLRSHNSPFTLPACLAIGQKIDLETIHIVG